MRSRLSENIKTFRKKRKMTQEQLAEAMGVTDQSHYDNFGKTAMEAAERRVMTDAELVPQLAAIWAEIKKGICSNLSEHML